MIRWKLNQLMAQKRMSGKKLSELLRVHPNRIYRLKRVDQMPKLDGNILNELCKVLRCDANDLIEYVPDEMNQNSKI